VSKAAKRRYFHGLVVVLPLSGIGPLNFRSAESESVHVAVEAATT